MKGALITLYGINNIGKSTHAKRLVERLGHEGYQAQYLKYPLYNLAPTGPKINAILRSGEDQNVSEEALQTLFMQNRKDFEDELKKLLAEGYIIVAEDYTQTGIAWGMAKGLEQNWIESLNAELLVEDFTILLIGKELGARAMDAREEGHLHESNDVLIKKVDQILRQRAKEKGWCTIEIQPEKDATGALVWQHVQNFLMERKRTSTSP